MEDLAVITPLDHLGSFGKNFAKVKEKSKNVSHQPGLVCIRKKLCPLSWVEVSPIRTSWLVNNISLSYTVNGLNLGVTCNSVV